MKRILRSPLLGGIEKHRFTITLLIVVIVLTICSHEEILYYKRISDALDAVVNETTENVQMLELENAELKLYISDLERELEEQKDRLIAQEVTKRDFKSYMPYTAITNKSSKQYKLQQQATTDSNGIRCIDSRPMVAVGTGWGLKVGDIALVTCENGNSFEVVIGDIKADKHTDAENKTTTSNGCRCEFIVDLKNLNQTVKSRGNVAVLEKYNGYVTNISKK